MDKPVVDEPLDEPNQKQGDRIRLSDGFSVTNEFFWMVLAAAVLRLPDLLRGVDYTAEDVVGPEYWSYSSCSGTKTSKRHSGTCTSTKAL
jgi:hypothetical protein